MKRQWTEQEINEWYAKQPWLRGTNFLPSDCINRLDMWQSFGGFTVNAFDCSSLTQYVFYLGANKLLGTTTRLQVKEGKAVKKSELSRGDCIYFTNASRYYNTGTERVGHVAIYLGNDYILHTSSDYARIEKLTAARKKYYIEARRFV